MHLLYADESGSIGDPAQNHFVLAGVSVFERETHWVETELNKIAARFSPHAPHDIELHGSPMRTGRHGWDQHPQADRHQAIIDALNVGVWADTRTFGYLQPYWRKRTILGTTLLK